MDAPLFRIVVVIECVEEPCHLPKGFEWVPIIHPREGCVVNVVHSEREARHDIHDELHGIANNVSPANPVPWAFMNWFEKTTLWVREALDRHDLQMIGPLEQIRISAHSTVLKINTNASAYYLKCSSATSNDAKFTSVMSAAAPNLVRKPLAVDVERRLMILKDHGEDFGICALSDDLRKDPMKSLARFHKTSTSVFDKLVDDRQRGRTTGCEGVSIYRIVRWEIPNCLVHNDVFSGNLTRNADGADNGFYLFDFDRSFGGHPVVDVDWSNRKSMEGYINEMGITDMDGWYELSRISFKMKPVIDAFRYIDKLGAAEEGGVRKDELAWLMRSFNSLVIGFK